MCDKCLDLEIWRALEGPSFGREGWGYNGKGFRGVGAGTGSWGRAFEGCQLFGGANLGRMVGQKGYNGQVQRPGFLGAGAKIRGYSGADGRGVGLEEYNRGVGGAWI